MLFQDRGISYSKYRYVIVILRNVYLGQFQSGIMQDAAVLYEILNNFYTVTQQRIRKQ